MGPTTTTEDPDIAAVRDAHLAYLAMLKVVGDPPNPDHPELSLRTTGDAFERLRANLLEDQLVGNRLVGGVDSSVRAINIDGDSAIVSDCMLDEGVVFGPQGQVIVAADESRALRTTRLTRTEGEWKVWRFDSPDPSEPCDA